ncbi:hypothetical protein C8R43DRAFT_228604 [Mycena crocata]|nr:hypothetical protein C8R43DRAFT_228604 [Mycena crocata]
MPPRKKQKTAAASSTTGTPSDFPSAAVLIQALQLHGDALSLRSKEHTKAPNELTDLETWLTSALLSKIAAQEPVTKADMTSLMKWKLSRGKSRPTLLSLIASNADALVLKSTSAALATARDAEDDFDRALLALPDACKMKGVGAATASALLTLQSPHLLPFMSDEAAAFFTSTLGPIKYTDGFYKKFAAAMVAEVRRLNTESDVAEPWDSMKLERALFAIAILKKHGKEELLEDASSTSDSLKRKRQET